MKRKKNRAPEQPLLDALDVDSAAEKAAGWIHGGRRYLCILAAKRGDFDEGCAVAWGAAKLQSRYGFDGLLGNIGGWFMAVCSTPKAATSRKAFLSAVADVSGREIADSDDQDLVIVARHGEEAFAALLAWVDGKDASLTRDQDAAVRRLLGDEQ